MHRMHAMLSGSRKHRVFCLRHTSHAIIVRLIWADLRFRDGSDLGRLFVSVIVARKLSPDTTTELGLPPKCDPVGGFFFCRLQGDNKVNLLIVQVAALR